MLDPASTRKGIALAPVFAVGMLAVLALYSQLRDPENVYDFTTWYFGTRALGLGLDPYNDEVLNRLANESGVEQHVFPYLYPPPLLQIAAPLRLLPLAAGRTMWLLMSALAGAVMFSLGPRLVGSTEFSAAGRQEPTAPSRRAIAPPTTGAFLNAPELALLTASLAVIYPFYNDLKNGQVNILMTCLVTVFLVAGSFPVVSGPGLAIAAAVKMLPGSFLGWPLLRGRWRVLASFGLSLAAIVLASILLGGGQGWQAFGAFLLRSGYGVPVHGNHPPDHLFNIGLAGSLARILGPGDARSMPIVVLAMMLVAFPLALQWRRADPASVLLGAAILSLLASPFVWMHHLVILWPGLVFVARDAWRCLAKQEKPASGIVRLALVLTVAWPYPNVSKALGFSSSIANVMSTTNLLLVLTLYTLVVARRSETRLETMEAPRAPGPLGRRS
jgi:alpha-1,2-mannosyltransferase